MNTKPSVDLKASSIGFLDFVAAPGQAVHPPWDYSHFHAAATVWDWGPYKDFPTKRPAGTYSAPPAPLPLLFPRADKCCGRPEDSY